MPGVYLETDSGSCGQMPTLGEEFERFWQVFPRKTAKLAAKKAYEKARKRTSAVEILEGVARYTTHKPAYADFCHPATFLNQGRWMDEYDAPTKSTASDWWTECQALHGGTCLKRWDHDMKVQADRSH
jgi:hypothetical protein